MKFNGVQWDLTYPATFVSAKVRGSGYVRSLSITFVTREMLQVWINEVSLY